MDQEKLMIVKVDGGFSILVSKPCPPGQFHEERSYVRVAVQSVTELVKDLLDKGSHETTKTKTQPN